MITTIGFDEIISYVEKNYSIRLQLKQIDERTLEVSYKPELFIPTIAVKIRIEAVRKDIVCLSYESSSSISLIFAGLVSHLDQKLPKGVVINTENKRIDIYLEQIKQLEKVLQVLLPSSIMIQEDAIFLVLSI